MLNAILYWHNSLFSERPRVNETIKIVEYLKQTNNLTFLYRNVVLALKNMKINILFSFLFFFSLTTAHALNINCIRSDISNVELHSLSNGKYFIKDLSLDHFLKDGLETEATIDYPMLIQFDFFEADETQTVYMFKNLTECRTNGSSKMATVLITSIKDGKKKRPTDQMLCTCTN